MTSLLTSDRTQLFTPVILAVDAWNRLWLSSTKGNSFQPEIQQIYLSHYIIILSLSLSFFFLLLWMIYLIVSAIVPLAPACHLSTASPHLPWARHSTIVLDQDGTQTRLRKCTIAASLPLWSSCRVLTKTDRLSISTLPRPSSCPCPSPSAFCLSQLHCCCVQRVFYT